MSAIAAAAPDEPEPNEGISTPIPGEWMNEVRLRTEAIRAEKGACGTYFELAHPEKAAEILWKLAQGVSINQVSRDTGVNRTVIRRVSWRHSDTLETKRKEFSREFALAAEAYKDLLLEKADRLMESPELLDAISPEKLALSMAISTDKSMALAGMAGVVIEHRKGASIDDAMKAIADARARSASKTVEAEIIEE